MAAAYASGKNTYVPSFETSGRLIVDWSRNVKDFPLMNYIGLTPIQKSSGYYLEITAEQAARVVRSNLADAAWPDGNDSPEMTWGSESFEFKSFETERYTYGYRLGNKAAEQADFQLEAKHAAIAAAQVMTARAVLVHTLLETTGTYSSGHTDTATNWGGAKWDQGTSTNPYIKRAINAMVNQITLATLAVVQHRDLCLVVSPTVARAMASSAEIHDYVKADAGIRVVKGEELSLLDRWGLPERLYGVKVMVENSVKVTNQKGAARSASYVASADDAYLMARPGELKSPYGSPSFCAVHIFAYEEMTAETKDDVDHRRQVGRVVEDIAVKAVAPAALCRATDCVT